MLEPKKKEFLSAKNIYDQYKEGRRDFSGVTCNNDSFDNFHLHAVIFRDANLDFCSFDGTNLSEADFQGASLEWTSFVRANLHRAKMEKVRAVWSKFNQAQFGKTNLRNADLSWSIFFDTNLYEGADLTGALTATIATDPSQITEEGMQKLAEHIGQMKGKIDPELATRLSFSAISTQEKSSRSKPAKASKDVYKDNSIVGDYSARTGYDSKKAQDSYNSTTGPYKKKKKDMYE